MTFAVHVYTYMVTCLYFYTHRHKHTYKCQERRRAGGRGGQCGHVTPSTLHTHSHFGINIILLS